MSDIRFVYFDLDDTLLDHRQAEAHALGDLWAMTPELHTIDLDRVREAYRVVNTRVWTEYAAGRRDKEGTRSGRFSLLFRALDLESDHKAAADNYLAAYADHWHLIDGAWDAYSHVHARYPTGLLTNGFAEAQRAKLARFPELTESLSSIVISEEEGVLKPDRKLFEIATSRAGVRPQDVLYVGDSWRSDIEGGLAAGWNVVWYSPTAEDAPNGVPVFSDWGQFEAVAGLE